MAVQTRPVGTGRWNRNQSVPGVLLHGQWLRLLPITWEVFPNALSTAIQYASLNFPVDHSWTPYNALQQLSYFITVSVAAPVSIATGLLQSPAISNRLGWTGRVLNRQVGRSIHFLSFSWFVLLILAHGIMVFVTSLRANTNHMFAGVESSRAPACCRSSWPWRWSRPPGLRRRR